MGFACQPKPDLGIRRFPSKEQHAALAADTLGKSAAWTCSRWAAPCPLPLCCWAPTPAGTTEMPHHRDGAALGATSLTTATATALLPLPTQVVENRREVWLRLSPKICIYCVEINFLTWRSCIEGLLQYRSGGISHVAIAFLLDPPEHLSRGGSSPAKCGRITPC